MPTIRASFAAGTLLLFLLSGLVSALPVASASSAVVVKIPVGANNPANLPGFIPQTITVVIGVNNTVIWENNDTGIHHTVATTSVPAGVTGFGSGDIAPGASFSYTFTVPGTYEYDCSYHPFDTGTVVVLAAASPTPEFPAALLAVTLFAAIAVAIVAVPHLRPGLQSKA